MFYYKIVEDGVVTGLMTASLRCESSETQVEITEEEFNQIMAELESANAETIENEE